MINVMTFIDIINFPSLDGDAPRRPSNGVYLSQLIDLLEYVVMLMILILVINA